MGYSDARTPKETCQLWETAGIAKANTSYFKTFAKAILGGMLLSFGGAFALKVGGGSPLLASQNPGLNSLVLALIFPIGLVAIVLTGAELVTANMAIFMVAHAKNKVAWYSGAVNLTIVTFGNLCGALVVAGLFVKASGLYSVDPYKSFVIAFATAKVVPPTFGMVIIRGIGCNFLVCIAVWQAASAREIYSKILGAYLPIVVFVGVGLDHVIANMLYIPAALMLGGTPFTTSDYIVKQLIAPWIGNLIGAAFFVGPMAYGYLYDDEMEMVLPGPSGSSMIQDREKLVRPSFIDLRYSTNSNHSLKNGNSINAVEQQVPSNFQDYSLPSVLHPYAANISATSALLLNPPLTSIQYGVALDGSSIQPQFSKGGRAKVLRSNEGSYNRKYLRGGYGTDFSNDSSTSGSDVKRNGKSESTQAEEERSDSSCYAEQSTTVEELTIVATSRHHSRQLSNNISPIFTPSHSITPQKYQSIQEKTGRKDSIGRILRREVVQTQEEDDQVEELSFELPSVTLGPRFSIGAFKLDSQPNEIPSYQSIPPQAPELRPIYLHDIKRDARALLDSAPTLPRSAPTKLEGIRRILPFLKLKTQSLNPPSLSKSPSFSGSIKNISITTSARKLQKKRPPMPAFPSSSFGSSTPIDDPFESTSDPTDLPPLQYYTLPRLPSTPSNRNEILTPKIFSSNLQMHRKSSSLPHFPTFIKPNSSESQSSGLTQQQIVSNLPLTRRKKKGAYKVKNLIISDWVKEVERKDEIENKEVNGHTRNISGDIRYPSIANFKNLDSSSINSPLTSAIDPMATAFTFQSSQKLSTSIDSLNIPHSSTSPCLVTSKIHVDSKFVGSSITPASLPTATEPHSTPYNDEYNLPPTHSPPWIRKRSTSLQLDRLPSSSNFSQHTHQSSLSSIDEAPNEKFRLTHRRIPTLESILRTETDSELNSLSNFSDGEDEIFDIRSDSSHLSHYQTQFKSEEGVIQPVLYNDYVTLPSSSPRKPTSSTRPKPIFARFPQPPSRKMTKDVFNGINDEDVVTAHLAIRRSPSLVKTGSLSRNGSWRQKESVTIEVNGGSTLFQNETRIRDFDRSTMGGKGAATALREMLRAGEKY